MHRSWVTSNTLRCGQTTTLVEFHSILKCATQGLYLGRPSHALSWSGPRKNLGGSAMAGGAKAAIEIKMESDGDSGNQTQKDTQVRPWRGAVR